MNLRFCLRRAAFCLTLLIAAHLVAHAQSPAKAYVEPLFGLSFRPEQADFALIQTAEFAPDCNPLLETVHPFPDKFLLFAEYKDDSKRLYIVGDGALGRIIGVFGGECYWSSVLAVLANIHSDPPRLKDRLTINVTDAERAGIFQDALARYADAFGGKQKFLAELDRQTDRAKNACQGLPDASCHLPPALQKLLADYRQGQ